MSKFECGCGNDDCSVKCDWCGEEFCSEHDPCLAAAMRDRDEWKEMWAEAVVELNALKKQVAANDQQTS